MNRLAFAFLALLLAAPVFAEDAPIEISVHSSFDREKEKVDKGDMGAGEEHVVNTDFTAKLSSKGLDSLQNITIKVYVMAAMHDWNNDKSDTHVLKVLEKKGETLGFGEEKEIPMGTVGFKNFQTYKDGVMWRGGDEYMGWVAEAYVGDKLVSTADQGSKEVKAAYKKFLSTGGKKPGKS